MTVEYWLMTVDYWLMPVEYWLLSGPIVHFKTVNKFIEPSVSPAMFRIHSGKRFFDQFMLFILLFSLRKLVVYPHHCVYLMQSLIHSMFQMVWIVMLLPALVFGCSERAFTPPPCSTGYITESCKVLEPGTNDTKLQLQCIKAAPVNVFQSWGFWFGLLFGVGVISKLDVFKFLWLTLLLF